MEEIHPSDLDLFTPARDFSIAKLPLFFDVQDLKFRLNHARTAFTWKTKDNLAGYHALGLQFSDPSQPFNDAIDATSEYEIQTGYRPFRMYEKVNEAGEVFDLVFRRLVPYRLFRSRLLTAHSGYKMPVPHVDGAVGLRLHIPIETNDQAWMEVDGQRFHLPADGSGYLVNTTRPHRIGNDGSTPRTHLVSVVYPGFPSRLHPISQAALIRLIEGPMNAKKRQIDLATRSAFKRAAGHCELCHEKKPLYPAAAKDFSPLPGLAIEARLKAVCGVCIEMAGRKALSLAHTEEEQIDVFESEISGPTSTGPAGTVRWDGGSASDRIDDRDPRNLSAPAFI